MYFLVDNKYCRYNVNLLDSGIQLKIILTNVLTPVLDTLVLVKKGEGQCQSTSDCDPDEHLTCGTSKVCECKSGYYDDGIMCRKSMYLYVAKKLCTQDLLDIAAI